MKNNTFTIDDVSTACNTCDIITVATLLPFGDEPGSFPVPNIFGILAPFGNFLNPWIYKVSSCTKPKMIDNERYDKQRSAHVAQQTFSRDFGGDNGQYPLFGYCYGGPLDTLALIARPRLWNKYGYSLYKKRFNILPIAKIMKIQKENKLI